MPSPADAAWLQSVFEGMDHARNEVTSVWGAERLSMLVSEEMRAKFIKQQTRWSEAYREAWETERCTRPQLEAVENAAGGMKRAYVALAAAASEAGHRPLAPDVWEFLLADGSVAAFVRTNDEAAKVVADGRFVSVFTLAELGRIIDMIPAALQLAKIVWPGARFGGDGDKLDKSWVKHGDEIPFGEVA